ncbi:EI24 domain-containing protein [Spirulina sp. CS-785/01]|uniref:EI24 domain-containing protein n=1 Tax=Spirulina sp. CS-785/01 TaxID=3021716 RepID=UPI00232BA7DF|nr:EI24 domain-containing protein [Spirulina sp. CS-785/01]MDB9313796.1 EI24 domain-containing protein [Spirulina sp. CS-785/01]
MAFGLITGATYPLRSLNAFRQSPRLLKFVIIPIGVNFMIAVVLYVSLLFPAWNSIDALTLRLDTWVDQQIADLPQWLGVLDYLIMGVAYLLRLIAVIVLFLVTGFILLQFGTLLGAPWYGKLSEEMEKFRLGEAEVIDVGVIRDIWRALLFEVKKLLLWIAIAIPLLILNFIPAVGTLITAIAGIALTAFIACLDFLDGPSERRRFPFRQKMGIVFKTLPASGSFSLVCWALISVPFINLITIPLCVASGTLFWCDRVLPKLSPQQRGEREG